jgi:hypothetical protein
MVGYKYKTALVSDVAILYTVGFLVDNFACVYKCCESICTSEYFYIKYITDNRGKFRK